MKPGNHQFITEMVPIHTKQSCIVLEDERKDIIFACLSAHCREAFLFGTFREKKVEII